MEWAGGVFYLPFIVSRFEGAEVCNKIFKKSRKTWEIYLLEIWKRSESFHK